MRAAVILAVQIARQEPRRRLGCRPLFGSEFKRLIISVPKEGNPTHLHSENGVHFQIGRRVRGEVQEHSAPIRLQRLGRDDLPPHVLARDQWKARTLVSDRAPRGGGNLLDPDEPHQHEPAGLECGAGPAIGAGDVRPDLPDEVPASWQRPLLHGNGYRGFCCAALTNRFTRRIWPRR